MIPIKPEPYSDFTCPNCESQNIEVKDFHFPGIHQLAECNCLDCQTKFLQDLPSGHGIFFPSIIDVTNQKFHPFPGAKWFTDSLWEGFQNQNEQELKIERKVFKDCSEVIILNVIDYLYGHSLLRLFNAQAYLEKYPEKGLIILTQANFEWLIPEGVAEVWVVPISFGKAKKWWLNLDSFVKNQLGNYDRVYWSVGYSHPQSKQIDIEKFTGINAFPITEFLQKPLQVTFIWREDRLWFRTPLEYFCFLVFRKLQLFKSLTLTKKLFLFLQKRRVLKVFKKLKKSFPEMNFVVVGMGKSVRFPKWIQDGRKLKIDEQVERQWCTNYANSQVVFGIHGSNMILPTALAAGFVEILPKDRLGNITQDVLANNTGKLQGYLGRFVNDYSSPKVVFENITAMLQYFPRFYAHNQDSHFAYQSIKSYQEIGGETPTLNSE